MKNTIEDLRNHMFSAIEELQDMEEKDPAARKRTIDKAKAIASLGTVIVNSVKTEVDFFRAGGKKNMEVMGKEQGKLN
jgi:hypothetical protein